MKDDSSFGNAPSTAGEPRKLFRQGATSNTFLTRYYGKLVLVKEIKPEYAGNMNYRMLFRKEFETGFSLNHPAIPRYLKLGEQDGNVYIMEEYVDGFTLTDFLQSNADYFHDPVNSDKFARQLLAVLHYLHQHQVLFLDLKPDNILITRIGHDVRLVDLGFAFVSGYPETAGLTPSFAAPEQREKQQVDERTDIWLYGRILQYVGVPPIYNKVVERCIQEQPGDRYADMEQLQHSLPPSPNSRRRSKLILALSFFLLLMVTILTVLFVPSASHPKQESSVPNRADTAQPIPAKQPQSPKAQPATASVDRLPAAAAPSTKDQAATPSAQTPRESTSPNAEQQRMLADLHSMMDRAFNKYLAVLRDSTFDNIGWTSRVSKYEEVTTNGKNAIIRKYPNIPKEYINEQYGRYMSKTTAPVLMKYLY